MQPSKSGSRPSQLRMYDAAQTAALAGKPIAAVNLGRTRADELLMLKVAQPCAAALAFLLEPR